MYAGFTVYVRYGADELGEDFLDEGRFKAAMFE